MIQGKDLMKGNIVEYNGYYAVVYSIFGPYPNSDERFNNKECVDLILGGMTTVTIDEINHVILTEEILLNNTPFQKDGKRYYYYCEDNHIIEIYFESYRNCFAMIYNGGQFMEIPFLHTLQNLINLITKQELEIKL